MSIFHLRRNSLQVKMFAFFFISFLLLGAVLTSISALNNRRVESLYEARTISEKEALKNELEDNSQLTKALAPDYATWDDTYIHLNGGLPDFGTDNLTESVLGTFSSDAMWLFHKDSTLAYKINLTEAAEGEIDFGSKKQAIDKLFEENYLIHFYMKTKTGIMEIYGSTVVPTTDTEHTGDSNGYLLVGKLISSESLASMQHDNLTLIKLLDPEQLEVYPSKLRAGTGTLVYSIDIKDIDGNVIGYVYANYQVDSIKVLHNSDNMLLFVNATTYVVLLVTVLFSVWRWVVRPVNTIYSSLQTFDARTIKKLAEKNTEFGEIAQLIDKFFEQERQSEAEIEAKKKLLDKLATYNAEIERTNSVMIGRELRMMELKKEIRLLKDQLGVDMTEITKKSEGDNEQS